nr:MAG TPA: hypothetical protein [Bacteriophage sp.]
MHLISDQCHSNLYNQEFWPSHTISTIFVVKNLLTNLQQHY